MCLWEFENCERNPYHVLGGVEDHNQRERTAILQARERERSTPANAVLPNARLEGVVDGSDDAARERRELIRQYENCGSRRLGHSCRQCNNIAQRYNLVSEGPPPPQQRPTGRAAGERVAMSPGAGGGLEYRGVTTLQVQAGADPMALLGMLPESMTEGRSFLDEVRNRMPRPEEPMRVLTPPPPSVQPGDYDDDDDWDDDWDDYDD